MIKDLELESLYEIINLNSMQVNPKFFLNANSKYSVRSLSLFASGYNLSLCH